VKTANITSKKYPRTLAEAFPNERAYAMENQYGHMVDLMRKHHTDPEKIINALVVMIVSVLSVILLLALTL